MKLLIIVIAMLATCIGAVHSWYSKNQYVQAAMISEAFNLVNPVKERVSDHFIVLGTLPHNSRELGLPEPENLVGTTVASVAVTLGGIIRVKLDGGQSIQTLSFLPAVNSSSGHLYWRCFSDTISKGVLNKLRPSCDHRKTTSESQLHVAAIEGNLDDLSHWLTNGANPDSYLNGLTSLMLSVNAGDIKSSKKLLDAGADPNLAGRTHDGFTPLIIALKAKNPALVRLLLESQASAQLPDRHGRTPSEYALQADIYSQSRQFSYLMHASLNPQFKSHPADSFTSRELSEGPEWIALSNEHEGQASPLESAIVSNNVKAAQELVANGELVNQITTNASSLLIEASKRGQTALVSMMIQEGAVVDATDSMGRTAYLAAMGAGHAELAALLVKAGANPRVSDNNGVDAVQMARSRARKVARQLRVASSEN